MGAWEFVRPRLKRALRGRARFFYLGRPRYSSPAEGSAGLHTMHQTDLLDKAMRLVTEKSHNHGEEY
jgi:2-oxoglutarate dehydrogenase E1 component